MASTRCTTRWPLAAPMLLSLLAALPSPVHAGASPAWSNDPAEPLAIADRAGEETQAKILPLADGGFYVSWFDNTDGGYDVRLQRLDADGRAQWPGNGTLVADRSFDWTTDYGFDVDTDGNAALSFQCCTQGAADERIVVAKIDPDGQPLWGDPGISVSPPGAGAMISKVAATGDGAVVVVWMEGGGQGLAQKLDGDGLPLWAAGGVIIPGPASGSKFIADVKAAGDGDAIVSWSHQPNFLTRILYAQKLASADGAALWNGEGVRVSDTGNLQAGYFPPILPDGAGGAVFAYYDVTGVTFDIRVQHVDAGGARRFGANGVLATLDTTRGHTSPHAAFDPATGDLHVAWIDNQTIGNQSYNSLYVQRIDADGQRRWGDDGLVLVPQALSTTGENALQRPFVLPAPDGALVAWATGNTSVTSHPIRAERLDADGNRVWPHGPASIKTRPTQTSRLDGATSALGYAAFVWSDAPDHTPGGNDVLGQNLQYTGFLGDTVFRHDFEAAE